MIDANTLARDYLAVWNDPDAASRGRRLAANWRADACYADPMMQGESRDGIATMISAARTQFPGHAFTVCGTPDAHGCFVRFSWTLAPDGCASVAAGTDVVRLDAKGCIAEVIGFLDGAAS